MQLVARGSEEIKRITSFSGEILDFLVKTSTTQPKVSKTADSLSLTWCSDMQR